MVAGQQQANWSGKGKSAVTSVSSQSLKSVVRRYFRWQVFYVLKDMARYVLSYSKPLELLPVTSCQREKKKSSFSFFRAQPMFEGTSKTLPCRVGSLSEVGLPMFQSDDSLCNSIIAACTT